MRELVPLDPNSCPDCGWPLIIGEAVQAPLFTGGAATQTTQWKVCSNRTCGYDATETTEVKP